MAREKNTGETVAMLLGLLVGAWVLTILIYAAVFVPVFKSWLTATFSHHWLGKIVISYAVFFLVWLGARTTLKDKDFGDINAWTWSTIALLVIVILLISAVMIWHYFAEWYYSAKQSSFPFCRILKNQAFTKSSGTRNVVLDPENAKRIDDTAHRLSHMGLEEPASWPNPPFSTRMCVHSRGRLLPCMSTDLSSPVYQVLW